MIRSITLMLLAFVALLGTTHAAVRITIDNKGRTETEVFGDQTYSQYEDEQMSFYVNLTTNTCLAVLHDQRMLVTYPCDNVKGEMEAYTDEMLKQQGMTREQMMAIRQQMAGNRPQNVEMKPAGTETIAGYVSECVHMGTGTMCTSAKVMALIDREFDMKKMISFMGQFEGSMMGEPSAEDKAKRKLWEKGYLMKDISLEMPNAGMLSMLPEETRKKMMNNSNNPVPSRRAEWWLKSRKTSTLRRPSRTIPKNRGVSMPPK